MMSFIFKKINFQRKRYFSVFGISVFLCGLSFYAEALEWTQQVDRLFKKWDRTNSPGVALAVVKDGSIVYQREYGMASLRFGLPLTSSTVFRCGSQSKQFTSFSILLLEAEGKLSLEDDIRMYLPEIPDFGRTITIEHLIYHTSGLQDYHQLMKYAGWYQYEDVVTKEQALDLLSRQTALNFEPGEQFVYCNSGYMLLAEIVARISGMPFSEFTRQRIFDPLGMSNSCFVENHQQVVNHLADAYIQTSEGDFIHTPINFACVGDGGLHSTVADMAKWDQNFYDPIAGNHALFERMHQRGILNDGRENPYSMGVFVIDNQGPQIIYHGGGMIGFGVNLVRIPDEHLSVITMANMISNRYELSANDLLMKSMDIIGYFLTSQQTFIQSYLIHEPSLMGAGTDASYSYFGEGNPNIANAKRILPSLDSGTAKDYLGRYYSEALDVFYRISLDEDGALEFRSSRGQRYLLGARAVRNDEILFDRGPIFRPNNPTIGQFLRNTKNEVVGFKLSDARIVDLIFHKAEIETLQ